MTDVAPRFLTPLRIEKIGDRRWLLIDDLIFRSAKYPGLVVAPRGFQTDFASIPRFVWSIWPPVGRWDWAAVVHDGAYGHALMTPHGDRIHAVKHVGDDWFNEGLQACGVSWFTRVNLVRAVRWFGDPDAHPLRS